MSTITTIASGDLISTSRTTINTNLSNLNTDKMETSVLDTDTTLAANSDLKVASQKAVKTYIDTSGGANASETVRGIVEEATDAEVTAGTATGATGAKLFVTPAKLATRLGNIIKFGGTGADGALSITGTTSIDVGAVKIYILNYTSISITGSGKLTFTNPHANGTIVIVKSQGNVTISSTTPGIDVSGLGGAGGTAGIGAGGAGGAGTNGTGILDSAIHYGAGGDGTPTAGLQLTTNTQFYTKEVFQVARKSIFLYCGSGGGGGAGSTNTVGVNGGAGGRGGGGLQIECAGALNFTGSVSVSGLVGAAGNNNTTGQGGGGGGGGSTGSCLFLYNTLTSSAGTISASGGGGGVGGSNTSGGSASGNRGYGGDGAGSFTAAGGIGGDADAGGDSGAGLGSGAGGGGGSMNDTGNTIAGGTGGGSEGGLVALNTEFI